MKRQFLRLYLFSALILIGLVLSFGQLYNALFYPESQRAVMVTQAELAQLMLHPQRQRIALAQLSLPSNLANELATNGYLLLSESAAGATQHFLYVADPDSEQHTIQFGPLQLLAEPEGQSSIFIAFYSLLALALLVVFKPLFSDLHRLQRAVIEFAEEPKDIPLTTSKRSSIYPLAQGLSDMSSRITHFLRLHQDLSRILSHEIRTPLSRIRLALSFLLGNNNTDPHDEALIEKALDDIEDRLEQYLSYARLENQFAVYELAEVDLDTIIQDKIQAAKAFTDIDIRFTSDVSIVLAEATSIAIAFQNLLGNSLKYANHQVSVSLNKCGEQVELCVADDGPGLPNNARDLLNPFQRGDNQPLSSGYGLGLYIVQRVAHWHQGELDVDTSSELGGACICVRWPGITTNQ